MILRPVTASWFELLTSREELGVTLECLAATGLVQLQSYSQSESRLALPDLRNTLVEYEALARRYATFWPKAQVRPPSPDRELLEAPRAALERLRAWAVDADPLIAELQIARPVPRGQRTAAAARGGVRRRAALSALPCACRSPSLPCRSACARLRSRWAWS